MPEIPFGDLTKGDKPAMHEEMIDRTANKRVERLREWEEQWFRPIGSHVNSKEEAIEDWDMLVKNPQQLMNDAAQRAQVVGPERAAYELVKRSREIRGLRADS